MFKVIKSAIDSRDYELKDMLKKINVLWVQGRLNDEQKSELISKAQNNADYKNSIDILKKLEELEKRISALENDEGKSEEPETNEIYTEYIAGKWYYNGDIVAFENAVYICTAPEGQVCTWSPSEYPAYWQRYAEAN